MPSTANTATVNAEQQPGVRNTRRSPRSSWRVPARLAAAAASTAAAVTVLLAGSGAALAAGASFVPEDVDAAWDGATATISFREVDVEVESDVTTVSVKAIADVDVVCTRGESTLTVRRSATAIDVTDYPIGDDGTVVGTARLPLEVRALNAPGYSCTAQRVSVTAVLEDFWTGATLVHRA